MARKAEQPFVSIIAGYGTPAQRVRRTTPIGDDALLANAIAVVSGQYPDDDLSLVPSHQPSLVVAVDAYTEGAFAS